MRSENEQSARICHSSTRLLSHAMSSGPRLQCSSATWLIPAMGQRLTTVQDARPAGVAPELMHITPVRHNVSSLLRQRVVPPCPEGVN